MKTLRSPVSCRRFTLLTYSVVMLMVAQIQLVHAYQCLLTVSDLTVNSAGAFYTLDWTGNPATGSKYNTSNHFDQNLFVFISL